MKVTVEQFPDDLSSEWYQANQELVMLHDQVYCLCCKLFEEFGCFSIEEDGERNLLLAPDDAEHPVLQQKEVLLTYDAKTSVKDLSFKIAVVSEADDNTIIATVTPYFITLKARQLIDETLEQLVLEHDMNLPELEQFSQLMHALNLHPRYLDF